MILKFFLVVRLESLFVVVLENSLVQAQCLFDGGHVSEVNRIRYLQTLHTVSVPPLLKVLFESFFTPIAGATTDLTLVFDTEAMKLEEPVGDWPAVPAYGEIFWVVPNIIIIVTIRISIQLFAIARILHFVILFI